MSEKYTPPDHEQDILHNLYTSVKTMTIEPEIPNDHFIAVAVPTELGNDEAGKDALPCGRRVVAAIRLEDRNSPADARSFALSSEEPCVQGGTTAHFVDVWNISILSSPVIVAPHTISTVLPRQLFEHIQDIDEMMHDERYADLRAVELAGNGHTAVLGEKETIIELEEDIHHRVKDVFDRRFQERIAGTAQGHEEVRMLSDLLKMGFVYGKEIREHVYPMYIREMAHAITSKSIPEGYEDVFHWFDWTYRVRMHDFEKLHAEETDGRYTPKGNLDMFAGDLSVYLEQAGLARLAEETDRDYIERVYREKE